MKKLLMFIGICAIGVFGQALLETPDSGGDLLLFFQHLAGLFLVQMSGALIWEWL